MALNHSVCTETLNVLDFGIFEADPFVQSTREIKITVKREASEFMFIANCPVWAEFTSEFVTDSSLFMAGLGPKEHLRSCWHLVRLLKTNSSNKYSCCYAFSKPKG